MEKENIITELKNAIPDMEYKEVSDIILMLMDNLIRRNTKDIPENAKLTDSVAEVHYEDFENIALFLGSWTDGSTYDRLKAIVEEPIDLTKKANTFICDAVLFTTGNITLPYIMHKYHLTDANIANLLRRYHIHLDEALEEMYGEDYRVYRDTLRHLYTQSEEKRNKGNFIHNKVTKLTEEFEKSHHMFVSLYHHYECFNSVEEVVKVINTVFLLIDPTKKKTSPIKK